MERKLQMLKSLEERKTKLKLKLVIVEDDQKMFDMAHIFVKDV